MGYSILWNTFNRKTTEVDLATVSNDKYVTTGMGLFVAVCKHFCNKVYRNQNYTVT